MFPTSQRYCDGGSIQPHHCKHLYVSNSKQIFSHSKTQTNIIKKIYRRYIIIIWTHPEDTLKEFLTALNNFHPSLTFTFDFSQTSTDYLDITIYKGPQFLFTNSLDTKTYQKHQNLYQYLYFTSNHPKKQHKAIITGECVRYVRTNTTQNEYDTMIKLFKERLKRRAYPDHFVSKAISLVKYEDRQKYLTIEKSQPPFILRPIFKCFPPPQFSALKHIILKDYNTLHLPTPRIITLGHRTLQQELIRARTYPTEEQLFDMIFSLPQPINPSEEIHRDTGKLPMLKYKNTHTQPCKHPRCVTCRHLNCDKFFRSSKTGKTYPLRHNFTCTSKNVIYLITCTKCKKQYVGLTTQQLNIRINHHRTNIFNKVPTYISNHFNFSDHSIENLSVQAIDKPQDSPNSFIDLQKLERHWIATLKTLQPFGLNVSSGKIIC